MKSISIILPTRCNPLNVYRLFDSIAETASNPGEIEIILYIDEDDTISHNISYSGLQIKKLIMPRDTMGNITRTCYKNSSGQYIMLMNDDVVFRTRNWDRAVIDVFGRFKDNIALVYGNDLIQEGKLATFPILSRTACDLTDGICPPEYVMFFIDAHIFDVFKKLTQLGHNRIVYLSEIVFEHMHYSVGKSDNGIRSGTKSTVDEMVYITSGEYRAYLAEKMAQYIGTFSRAGGI